MHWTISVTSWSKTGNIMCYSIVRYSLRALGEEHLGLELADLFDCCASAFIAGNGAAGSAAFTKSDEVSCDDAKVVDQLKLPMLPDVVGSTTGFGHSGGTQSQEKYVYNADGLQLGAYQIQVGPYIYTAVTVCEFICH
jgi:hypothetical protein